MHPSRCTRGIGLLGTYGLHAQAQCPGVNPNPEAAAEPLEKCCHMCRRRLLVHRAADFVEFGRHTEPPFEADCVPQGLVRDERRQAVANVLAGESEPQERIARQIPIAYHEDQSGVRQRCEQMVRCADKVHFFG